MKRLWLLSVATISLVLMAAQEAEPPGFQQWTPVSLKPYEQRMHDDAAAGSATLIVGGTLLNGETVAPHEKRNGTIQGGVSKKLSAGDVVRIPPRVPHQLLLESAHEFNYFVVKIKGY